MYLNSCSARFYLELYQNCSSTNLFERCPGKYGLVDTAGKKQWGLRLADVYV